MKHGFHAMVRWRHGQKQCQRAEAVAAAVERSYNLSPRLCGWIGRGEGGSLLAARSASKGGSQDPLLALRADSGLISLTLPSPPQSRGRGEDSSAGGAGTPTGAGRLKPGLRPRVCTRFKREVAEESAR